jgi:predicted SAM-dependent methyltransferase
LLEQFPQDETDEILKELKRVLGPKGELRLTVANLDWIADQVKAGKVTGPVLNMIYGDNRKTAFTSKMLEERLKEIGLPKISFKSDGGDLSVIARAKRA